MSAPAGLGDIGLAVPVTQTYFLRLLPPCPSWVTDFQAPGGLFPTHRLLSSLSSCLLTPDVHSPLLETIPGAVEEALQFLESGHQS